MDKACLKTYTKAYLFSFLIFFFIAPFIAILFPPLIALFIPFILYLLTFSLLGGYKIYKTFDKNKTDFLLVFIVSLVLILIDSFLFSNYTYRGFELKSLLFLLFIPLQTLTEEIIFRQFPLVLTENTDKKWIKWIAIILSPTIFALMHIANPEVIKLSYLLYYFFWGLFALLITLYTKSISATFAFHTVNNIFIAMIMNYPDSTIPLYSLFIKTETVKLNHAVTFTFVAYFIIGILLILKRRNYHGRTEKN